MSERRSSALIMLLMFLASTSVMPFVSAQDDNSESEQQNEEYSAGGEVFADISQFDPANGHPYFYSDDGEAIVSASAFMKKEYQSILQDNPDILSEDESTSSTSARTGARACTRHTVGETLTVPNSGGSVDVYVAKITNTVAFMVQNGRTLSSTVLNNWASTWDQTIYPTLTTYFGKDYGDGRGLAPPDKDNNCQIQVIIYDIDGAYGTGGYFAPGLSGTRESVFVDFADATLSWSKVILAHELQHLMHNAQDPNENLWLDEGAADLAAFLCFGESSTLTGHSNAWTQDSKLSVRWWNQRIADYGAGFMFVLYLADQLGGAQAIRNLVADSATGGAGVVNLARAPVSGNPGKIGRTMPDIFANFSIAATLDSDQGIYGYSNIDMTQTCGSSNVCKIQPADTYSQWSTPYSSTGNSIEGWGVRVFKFTASGPSNPLTMRFTSDQNGFDGRLVTRSAVDGLYSVSKLDFNNKVATGLVPGFGNLSDEVYAIVWYGSNIADCDYTSCGPSYPTGVLDVEATMIFDPATIAKNKTVTSDRDGDGQVDTAEFEFGVTSSAFFEDLNVEVKVLNSSGVVKDKLNKRVQAGGGVAVMNSVWFTAQHSDTYTFEVTMSDLLGNVIKDGTITSSPIYLENMKPVANGSVVPLDVQTWEDLQFSADGFDAWGLSEENNTLPYLDSPVAYAWDFDDNNVSAIKGPKRSYKTVGQYNVTLRVQDVGGTWSDTDIMRVNVTDTTVPIPVITVNGQIVNPVQGVSIKTNQHIAFSADRTSDNVPLDHLDFSWNWGDGNSDSGKGEYSFAHSWGDIAGPSLTYMLNLSVFDGINTGYLEIPIHVNNRLPVQIFSDVLEVYTYSPLRMPDVFEDDDGEIISWNWQFSGSVNLDGTSVDRTSTFLIGQSSTSTNPMPAWNAAGNEVATLTVTDDDGGISIANLTIVVRDQTPFATFVVNDESSGLMNIDFREVDAEVDVEYTFDGRSSYDPDGVTGDYNDLVFNWTFSDGTFAETAIASHTFPQPGEYSVSLIVTDEANKTSDMRTVWVRVINPTPLINVQILDGWKDGKIVTSSTPLSEGEEISEFSHTFTEDGDTFAAPNALLFFDSSGTRDGDKRFESKDVPLLSSHPDWNGIVEYTWDFGDATPLSHEPSPWHSYSISGTYEVTLTVRDSHLTGDVARKTFTVIVDEAPVIHDITLPDQIIVDENYGIVANVSDLESDADWQIWRDLDVLDGKHDDHDTRISNELVFKWLYDERIDVNENGIYGDDFVEESPSRGSSTSFTWASTGETTLHLEVCDGLGACDLMKVEFSVSSEPEEDPSLSEFSADEWKSWLSEMGGESAVVLGLIAAVLILGWLVMRQPEGVEEDAEIAAAAYQVDEVESFGGVLGMDQHTPPPAPALMSVEERRSSDSGYVRPLRGRR